jgi:hypothetical protein
MYTVPNSTRKVFTNDESNISPAQAGSRLFGSTFPIAASGSMAFLRVVNGSLLLESERLPPSLHASSRDQKRCSGRSACDRIQQQHTSRSRLLPRITSARQCGPNCRGQGHDHECRDGPGYPIAVAEKTQMLRGRGLPRVTHPGLKSSLSQPRLRKNLNSVEAKGSLWRPARALMRGEPAKRHRSQ